jgi:hypothetical protein
MEKSQLKKYFKIKPMIIFLIFMVEKNKKSLEIKNPIKIKINYPNTNKPKDSSKSIKFSSPTIYDIKNNLTTN